MGTSTLYEGYALSPVIPSRQGEKLKVNSGRSGLYLLIYSIQRISMSVINSSQLSPLSVNEGTAAKLLGLSASTLFNLRREGRIESVKLGSGKKSRVLYSVDGLRRFLESNTQETK